MGQTSAFVRRAKAIEQRLTGLARPTSLRKAFLRALACDLDCDSSSFADLRAHVMGWNAFHRKYEDRILRIAGALYCIHRHKITRSRAASLLELPLGDIEYVLSLAHRVGMSLNDIGSALNHSQRIRSGADAYFDTMVVSFDERALEDMVLATVESYEARGGKKGERYKECYGWCLGYLTRSEPRGHEKRTTSILRIMRVVTQMRAQAGASFVIPNDGSARAIRRVAGTFFPHLKLLGDYHTHPYQSRKRMLERKGWMYSSTDQRHIAEWVKDVQLEGGDPRFSIVISVARGERSGRRMARLATNRWKIGVDNLSLIVAIFRILRDKSYDENVRLELSHLGDLL